MPVINCPIAGCSFQTPDVYAVVVAALLTPHTTIHAPVPGANNTAPAAKVEQVKHPTVSSAGTSEDWLYFQYRWKDYVDATKITGKDLMIQLLECCEENLRKDLTRNIGGSLRDKTENVVLASIKTLAVRQQNIMVAQAMLYNMHQDRDEIV